MYTPGFKSYLVSAVYEYCVDHGLQPMVTVCADDSDKLLAGFAKMGFVTLDLSNSAVRGLSISKKSISFRTRFHGKVEEIELDIDKIAWLGSACKTCGMRFDFVKEVSANAPNKPALDGKSAETDVSARQGKENKVRPNLRLL